MILRLSDSLSRGLVVAAALAVGLWLTFFGVRAAIARHDSETDLAKSEVNPAKVEIETAKRLQSAVRLEPGNPAYWYALGRFQQYNLEQPDAAMAEQSYRKAIALNQDATDAWLDLATAYELDGETEEARDAYQLAKKSYPVSADVSWRYGNFLLRQGEQAPAYAELRRAIEADPHRAAAAFSRAYRTNPNVDVLLTQLLPSNPGVYADVISEAARAKQLAVAKIVWARLLTLHPSLMVDHFEPLVSELQQAGEFKEARDAWDQGTSTMNLPPLLRPQGSVVWDPSFESDINGYPFSWNFQTITQGVNVALDKREKHSGNQSLRLTFDGKHNPNLEAACTFAVVEPGITYRLSGWIETKDITTKYGIGFRIRSYGTSEAPLVNTNQIYGNNPFTLIDQSWTAGPGVHRVRICVIREPSDDPNIRISGTAWVDDVNLVPQFAEHRKP